MRGGELKVLQLCHLVQKVRERWYSKGGARDQWHHHPQPTQRATTRGHLKDAGVPLTNVFPRAFMKEESSELLVNVVRGGWWACHGKW